MSNKEKLNQWPRFIQGFRYLVVRWHIFSWTYSFLSTLSTQTWKKDPKQSFFILKSYKIISHGFLSGSPSQPPLAHCKRRLYWKCVLHTKVLGDWWLLVKNKAKQTKLQSSKDFRLLECQPKPCQRNCCSC